jgi:ankyrin repeat protein
MIEADPSLLKARGNLDPSQIGYFSGATLLHYVAGNPNRVPLPKNIVEIARFLLEAGSDVHASTIGPNCGDTMSLVITSRYSSLYGAAGGLIDVLMEYGAKLDVHNPDVIHMSLSNHSPLSAEKMIELGATADVCASAALGRMDLLKKCFDRDGNLIVVTKRNGKKLSDRDAIGLALLLAYVNKKPEAVDYLLEKDGNWNMIGVNNGAALHRAAIDGDLPMVQRLVAKGADIHNRDNPFNATPFSWAEHNGQKAVLKWMRAHCAIDLHDAVGFELPEHVKARLREDPKCVNRRIDQWSLPQCTALHVAALTKHVEIAKTLLEYGADKNIIAGDGRTALEIAKDSRATEVAALLKSAGN